MSGFSTTDITSTVPQPVFLKDYQAPAYFIDEIKLHIDLYEGHTEVKSQLVVRRNPQAVSSSSPFILNGEAVILQSLRLNGVILTSDQYELTPTFLMIKKMPAQAEIEIITKIHPEKNTALSGLYRSAKTYCTQCEAEGFRRITYFTDRPDVLSRYTTTITADAVHYPYLLSNGNLIASGKLESGRHFATWQDPFKKPCYLFALVAGDFDVLEDHFMTQSGRTVVIRIYVEKGYGDQAHHAMFCVKEAMRWDEQRYGREYDLDIYMIVAIGDFNMGAMENKGLNIFNTKYILAKPETATDEDYIHVLSVIGHEYFHNWSGNRVTCRDWFQLSLKEGLTIFRDQSFTEELLSAAVMRIRDVQALRETQFPEDAGPLVHPVRPESYIEINNFYTATVYNKGAEVLRMLQTILGKSLFRQGMDLYFERYDGHAVTIEDYIHCMEIVSGIDLKQFRLWYSQSRTPVVTVEGEYDANAATYTLRLQQSCDPTPGEAAKQPFYIPIRIALLDESGQALPLHIQNEAVANESIATEKVILLQQTTQTLAFHSVQTKPVPSLLRHFSAPVKLHYAYTDADLSLLCLHDTDAFNRWEAGQQLAIRVLLNAIRDVQQENALDLPADILALYGDMLNQSDIDHYLLAEMLQLPSERYIGEQMTVIDVDAIHQAREYMLQKLAERWQALLLERYQTLQTGVQHGVFNVKTIGQRELKNRCLAYLMLLPAYTEIGMQQFNQSLKTDMTDTQAALISLVNQDSPLREDALAQFYAAWKQDALVVDKWLAIQAATKLPSALSQVKKLMRHEAFDIKNPNKVYALIGTFAYRNAIHFHVRNGEGYAFLSEVVQQLDGLNPQIAARMVKPLTTWKRYDKERQALMRAQLEVLLQKSLSNDVYELVSKSLD